MGQAVVVLSNNDGCVIARSPAAKALGIKMGVPAFQIKNLIDAGRVVALSSNYTLYGDMSARVMKVLASMVDGVEIYSIDEAFFHIPDGVDYTALGRRIAVAVMRSTGIPVSIGIAPTKTLAKVANHIAKKYPGLKRVCVIDNDDKRVRALKLTPIDDVWGIGRRYTAQLRSMGVDGAWAFSQLPRTVVRRRMTVGGERTWSELNGVSCIDLDTGHVDKQQICTSRSFGEMLGKLEQIQAPITTFAARCAEKLRSGRLVAGTVMVFLYSNRFRPELPQVALHRVVALPYASNDTRVIVAAALGALRSIYRSGYQYKKAGVIVGDISTMARRPVNLFAHAPDALDDNLMAAIDAINKRFGKNTVRLTAELVDQKWQPAHHKRSPNYTTDIDDIIEIWCK